MVKFLEADAAKNFASGNFILGGLEVAAIPVVAGLTGAAAGAVAGTSSSAANGANNPNNQQPTAGVTVNVYGDSLSDPQMVANMATRISQAAQQLNVPFVATGIFQAGTVQQPTSTAAVLH
jgi:hypothetical protein